MRILLAEDNAVMAKVLSFNLSRAGFDVRTCENGRVALEAAQMEPFALLITDYQMPEMNGEELCRRLRQLPAYENTPVILCSAKGFEIDADRLKAELGISTIIYKPFSPERVVAHVKTYLNDGDPAAPQCESRVVQQSVGRHATVCSTAVPAVTVSLGATELHADHFE